MLQPDEETRVTEISFLPDGRISVFGMSHEVLQLLGELELGDPRLARRWQRLQPDANATEINAGQPALQTDKGATE